MKATRLIGISAALVTLAGYGSLAQADAAAGKATFEDTCSECHEVADFDGERPEGSRRDHQGNRRGHEKAQEGAQADGRADCRRRGLHGGRRQVTANANISRSHAGPVSSLEPGPFSFVIAEFTVRISQRFRYHCTASWSGAAGLSPEVFDESHAYSCRLPRHARSRGLQRRRQRRRSGGKAKFTAACAECHEVADFEGETAAALTETLKKIVAGKQKHKNALKLSDAEIADLAAYMAAGK